MAPDGDLHQAVRADPKLADECCLRAIRKVARIPTAVVERGGSDTTIREDSDAIWYRNATHWQMPVVTVAVDEMHADAVTSIIRQRGPVRIEERMAQSHRRQDYAMPYSAPAALGRLLRAVHM